MLEPDSRRRFLISFFEKFIFIIAGLTIFTLIVRYVVWGRDRRKREIFIGEEEDLKSAKMKRVKFKSEEIVVMWRKDKVVAFSLTCPHLGCKVRWREWEKKFWCPCHGAEFDENGNVISGPPPSPLKEYPVKKRGKGLYLVLNV